MNKALKKVLITLLVIVLVLALIGFSIIAFVSWVWGGNRFSPEDAMEAVSLGSGERERIEVEGCYFYYTTFADDYEINADSNMADCIQHVTPVTKNNIGLWNAVTRPSSYPVYIAGTDTYVGSFIEYNRERFYGVVRFSEESNQLVVYIPSIGDVAIPESEGCCSCFDGHEENDDNTYQLKVGDLVSINFRYEKSWDDNSVQIMETYPAKFDRKAHLIEALEENISFGKTDDGYVLSFPSTAEIDSAEIGDALYFIQHGGYDGRAYKKLYASGEIIAKADGIITVILSIPEGETEFLNYFNEMTIELTWEE